MSWYFLYFFNIVCWKIKIFTHPCGGPSHISATRFPKKQEVIHINVLLGMSMWYWPFFFFLKLMLYLHVHILFNDHVLNVYILSMAMYVLKKFSGYWILSIQSKVSWYKRTWKLRRVNDIYWDLHTFLAFNLVNRRLLNNFLQRRETIWRHCKFFSFICLEFLKIQYQQTNRI